MVVSTLVQFCMLEPLGWCWYSMGMVWYVIRCGVAWYAARYVIWYVGMV